MNEFRPQMLLLIAVLAHAVGAEQVYRSVDADGAVTFSDRPTEQAIVSEPVALPPAPSEADVKLARERAEQAIQTSEEMAEQREETAKAREQARRDRQRSQAAPPNWQAYPYPPPSWNDNYPAAPAYPVYPRRPRPRYPAEWAGPGDHPAFRPGWPRHGKPRPGHRPVRPEEPTQYVLPKRKDPR